MEEQDTINLKLLKDVIWEKRKIIAGIVLSVTIFAIILSLILPKSYESSVLLKAKGAKAGGLSMQAVAATVLLGGAGGSSTQNFIEILKSRSVLNPVIAQLDLPEEDKAKLDNEAFAKSFLQIDNKKGTDLITLAASGRSPEQAQMIAAETVKSFQQVLTKLNQSEQSGLMQFLGSRVKLAEQEMQQAENALEAYRQKEKIYVPEEQAKGTIQKLFELDQTAAQYKVENQTNAARLQAVNAQLQKQNAALTEYNLADSEEVQKIRDAIITKQIAMVGLQQRYTDEHPQVIVLKTELAELQNKLKETIAQAVTAGTMSLNPVHAGLLQAKIETETQLQVGQAALAALTSVQAENEQEISRLSAGGTTYIALQRQVVTAQEVYKVLVQNYEQARVQEAMESMDIQIIDEANLPAKPAGPRKLLFAVVGLAAGMLLGFGYVMFIYTKKSAAAVSIAR